MSMIGSVSPILTTPADLQTSMVENLNTDQSALATVEGQLSSGFEINHASDNPAGAANILQLQGSLTRANQYATNAANGVDWLQLANSTVNSVSSTVQSVLSTVQGITGEALSGSSSALSSAATSVADALSQLTDLANTTVGSGQPLFAGTGSSIAAYDKNGNYLGNSTVPTRTVAPGSQVAVSVTGPTIFGSGPTGLLGTGQGGSSVGVLQQIVNDLTTAASSTGATRQAAINAVTGTDLQNLQGALSTVESAAGTLGANQQSVESFSTQATASATAIEGELSSIQDVNVAQATTNLQLQQDAYQAALYATSQISADTLAKYL